MNRSRSRSASTTSQSTDTQNLNLQDIDGVAVAGVGGDVSIETTDQGAVDAARDIAVAGIDATERGFNEVADLTSDIINASREQTETIAGSAVTLAQEGFDFAGAITADAFASSEEQTAAVLNFAADAQDGVFDLVEEFGQLGSDLLTQQSDFVADTGDNFLAAVDRVQARESGNTDARLQEVTRVALIGAAVIAVAAIATQLRR